MSQWSVSCCLPTERRNGGGFIARRGIFVALASTGGQGSGSCGSMSSRVQTEAEVDRIARTMAAGAGIAWDRLDTYPGYMRGYWRGEARLLLGRLADAEGRA